MESHLQEKRQRSKHTAGVEGVVKIILVRVVSCSVYNNPPSSEELKHTDRAIKTKVKKLLFAQGY